MHHGVTIDTLKVKFIVHCRSTVIMVINNRQTLGRLLKVNDSASGILSSM